MNTSVRFIVLVVACIAVPVWAMAQSAAPAPAAGTIRGTVLDRAGGTPIADVSVRIQDGGQPVTTDAAGRFEAA